MIGIVIVTHGRLAQETIVAMALRNADRWVEERAAARRHAAAG